MGSGSPFQKNSALQFFRIDRNAAVFQNPPKLPQCIRRLRLQLRQRVIPQRIIVPNRLVAVFGRRQFVVRKQLTPHNPVFQHIADVRADRLYIRRAVGISRNQRNPNDSAKSAGYPFPYRICAAPGPFFSGRIGINPCMLPLRGNSESAPRRRYPPSCESHSPSAMPASAPKNRCASYTLRRKMLRRRWKYQKRSFPAKPVSGPPRASRTGFQTLWRRNGRPQRTFRKARIAPWAAAGSHPASRRPLCNDRSRYISLGRR